MRGACYVSLAQGSVPLSAECLSSVTNCSLALQLLTDLLFPGYTLCIMKDHLCSLIGCCAGAVPSRRADKVGHLLEFTDFICSFVNVRLSGWEASMLPWLLVL